jgi:hypothetical protein
MRAKGGDGMTAEQFLNSIRGLDCEINALDMERCRWMDRRQDLLESAESHSAITGVVVQHAIGSKTESIGIQLASLETPEEVVQRINRYQERINRKIDKLVARKERALVVIDRVENTTHRALLLYRYFNCLKWETIADLMGYEPNYTRFELKQAAIAAYEAAAKDLS